MKKIVEGDITVETLSFPWESRSKHLLESPLVVRVSLGFRRDDVNGPGLNLDPRALGSLRNGFP